MAVVAVSQAVRSVVSEQRGRVQDSVFGSVLEFHKSSSSHLGEGHALTRGPAAADWECICPSVGVSRASTEREREGERDAQAG